MIPFHRTYEWLYQPLLYKNVGCSDSILAAFVGEIFEGSFCPRRAFGPKWAISPMEKANLGVLFRIFVQSKRLI